MVFAAALHSQERPARRDQAIEWLQSDAGSVPPEFEAPMS